MRGIHLGAAGTAALALLIGCGGGGAAPAGDGSSGATTTAVGTTSVVGTTTTGATAPSGALPAGTSYGTYSSTAFSSGGASTPGPSGDAELVVEEGGGFVLTLGADSLEGVLPADSGSFSGTFTVLLPSGGEAVYPVSGLLVRSASRTILRFSAFRDDAHASGVRYSAGFATPGG